MVGEYVTKERALKPLLPLKMRVGGHNPGDIPYDFPILDLLQPSEVTYTWQTKSTGADQSHQLELENDLRIFRNGFTSSDPVYDRGHEFSNSKTSGWYSHKDAFFNVRDRSGFYEKFGWFRGPLVPDFRTELRPLTNSQGQTISGFDPYPAMPNAHDFESLGTKAIGLTAPTAPHANAATFIGELREGLPKMFGLSTIQNKTRVFRSAGDEYVNVQFGWKPMVADLRKFVSSLLKASQEIQQLQRDSGRQVRRRLNFAPTVDTDTKQFVTPSGPYLWSSSGWYPFVEQRDILHKTTRTERSVWFSGAFTYFVPSDDRLMSKLRSYDARANVLLGTRLSPSVLWELAPWSWLLDWQGTIGDVLNNADLLSSDNLVLRYGYLMVHTKQEYQYQVQPGLIDWLGQNCPAVTATFSRETKQRVQATPYGFGVHLGDLNAKQNAILAALGLSRGKH